MSSNVLYYVLKFIIFITNCFVFCSKFHWLDFRHFCSFSLILLRVLDFVWIVRLRLSFGAARGLCGCLRLRFVFVSEFVFRDWKFDYLNLFFFVLGFSYFQMVIVYFLLFLVHEFLALFSLVQFCGNELSLLFFLFLVVRLLCRLFTTFLKFLLLKLISFFHFYKLCFERDLARILLICCAGLFVSFFR